MNKPKFYSEYEAQYVVNDAINDTAIEDDEVERYYEAAMDVLTGKLPARSAASNSNLDIKQLESLIQLAKKKLDSQKEKNTPKAAKPVEPDVVIKQDLDNEENNNPAAVPGCSNVVLPAKNNNPAASAPVIKKPVDLPVTNTTSATEKQKVLRSGRGRGRPQKRKEMSGGEVEKEIEMEIEIDAERREEEEQSKKNEEQSKAGRKRATTEKAQGGGGVTVRKKRRNVEEVLQQEARELVFRGSSDVDVEPLALVLYREGAAGRHQEKSAANVQQKQLQQQLKPPSTRSRTSLELLSQQKPVALPWKENEIGADLPCTSASVPETNAEVTNKKPERKNAKGGGRGRRKKQNDESVTAASSVVTTPTNATLENAATDCKQLVLYNRNSATLANTNKPMPSIPHEDITAAQKTTTTSPIAAVQQNASADASMIFDNNAALVAENYHRKVIVNNPRWQEFPRVVEDVIDEVLMNMNTRNEVEKTKKMEMRLAVGEVILRDIAVTKVATARKIGITSLRRYLRDTKIRLEMLMGAKVVDDQFLRQFKKNARIVTTLEQFKSALKERNNNVENEAPSGSSSSTKKQSNASKKSQKSGAKLEEEKAVVPFIAARSVTTTTSLASQKRQQPPKQTSSAKNAKNKGQQQQTSTTPPSLPTTVVVVTRAAARASGGASAPSPLLCSPPPTKKQSVDAVKSINWGKTKPTAANSLASAASSSKTALAATRNELDDSSLRTDAHQIPNEFSVIRAQEVNNQALLTSTRFERKPLRGTQAQIRQLVQEFFANKYSGPSEQFAEIMSAYITMECRIKKMLHENDFPQELIKSGLTLLARFYKIEEAEILSDDE